MAESLPTVEFYYREKGAGDAAWEKAVGGQFQAVDGTEYDVCCVKPSALSSAKWVDARAIVRYASWVASCADRCVDFVGIGDSNQSLGGVGWDDGFQIALLDNYEMYASGIVTSRENGGSGSGLGYKVTALSANEFPQSLPTGTVAGDSFAAGAPLENGFVPDGSTISATNGPGVYVSSLFPPIKKNILFEHWYAGFDYGSGVFRTTARMGSSPFSVVAINDATSTNVGEDSVIYGSLDIPANAGRNYGLTVLFTDQVNDITGPFANMYMRVRDHSATSGFSYSTFIYRGGESLRGMLYQLQNSWNETSLSLYFSIVRNGQAQNDKRVIIYMISGVNDINETLPSLGPSPVEDADSAEAYADNLRGIINLLTNVWVSNGWPTSELLFVLSPSPPISDPNNSELEAYIPASIALQSEYSNFLVIPFQSVTSYAEMYSLTYYASNNNDFYHLVPAAYTDLAGRLLAYTGE